MYIDCSSCDFESHVFFALDDETITKVIECEGGSARKSGKELLLTCPNGHNCIVVPTIHKYLKRYQYPKLKNDDK